jgi:hypothetical protein
MHFCMNLPKQIRIPNVERVPLVILVKVFKQQVSIKFQMMQASSILNQIIIFKLIVVVNFHTYMQEMV